MDGVIYAKPYSAASPEEYELTLDELAGALVKAGLAMDETLARSLIDGIKSQLAADGTLSGGKVTIKDMSNADTRIDRDSDEYMEGMRAWSISVEVEKDGKKSEKELALVLSDTQWKVMPASDILLGEAPKPDPEPQPQPQPKPDDPESDHVDGTKRDFSKVQFADIEDQVWSGGEIRPAIAIYWQGERLLEGVDYTLSYADNVNRGTATVTATGIGNYEGTKSTTFQIIGRAQATDNNANAGTRMQNIQALTGTTTTASDKWLASPEYEYVSDKAGISQTGGPEIGIIAAIAIAYMFFG
jgi:hypothetical protein